MFDTPFLLKQVTRTTWVGEELTTEQIQFLDSIGVANESPNSGVLLEVSYNLELYRRMSDSSIHVHIEITAEGIFCVFMDGSHDPVFWSPIQSAAIERACACIQWRS